MSQNKAALTYNIPVMTLSDRIHGKYETNKQRPPTKLGAKAEFFLYTMIC